MTIVTQVVSETVNDVIIVGFGPTGAILANLLGRQGRRVLVIEQGAGVYPLPRAVHFDAEIMRVFQQLQLAEVLLPQLEPVLGAEFMDTNGERIVGIATEEPVEGPMSWVNSFLFHQPSLEVIVRDTAAAFDGVEILIDQEVIALDDRDGAVTVTYEDRADQKRQTARGRYLIACDGARSFVRTTLDMGVESLGFDQEWLVADIVLKRDIDLPNTVQQICDPSRPITVVPGVGSRRRWELQLQEGETREEMERPERVWELLSPWITPDDADIERAVVYEFHGLVAGNWRRGRVFLAGDAAHQMPPFMGQGMCSGIRDAANIAWKLNLVLDGIAEDRLLDQYEMEREPHARYCVDHSVEVGRLIDTLAAKAAGLEVEVDHAPAYGGSREPPYLQHGVLRSSGDNDPFTGRLFVQPRVIPGDLDQVRLDDLLGDGFALVARTCPLSALSADSLAFLDRIGARSQAVPKDREVGGLLDTYIDNGGIVVVRPDRYVFTVAYGIEDLELALATLKDMLALTSNEQAKEQTI
jgi:3-(3-hydroxy-phenyl)propionate hydroxylase